MKKLLVTAAIVGTAYGAWNLFSDSDASSTRNALDDVKATDRLWIDRLPRSEREIINVFLTLSDESLGVFQAGSRWRASYELFMFEADGGELRIHYPQTNERERVTAKVTECDEDGFDYCLDLDGGTRGVKRYHSMKGWEIDSVDAAETKLRALAKPAAK